jgi:hypothetical protein
VWRADGLNGGTEGAGASVAATRKRRIRAEIVGECDVLLPLGAKRCTSCWSGAKCDFCGFAAANVEIRPGTGSRLTFSSPTKENVERRPDQALNSTFAAAPRAERTPELTLSMPQLTYTNADIATQPNAAAPTAPSRGSSASKALSPTRSSPTRVTASTAAAAAP